VSAHDCFAVPPRLAEHGLRSGLAVAIPGPERPAGVLAAHSRRRRVFAPDEAAFAGAVAGMLGRAIHQRRTGDEHEELLRREQAARAEAEAARRRFAFLAEAGAVLASSLDFGRTLARVAELAVPFLADWCVVDVFAGRQAGHRVAVAHADPGQQAPAEQLRRRWPLAPDALPPALAPIAAGHPVIVPELFDASLPAFARDPEHLALLRALRVVGYVCVPLAAHGRLRGAVTFLSAESGRRYGADELALAGELARRAALALDNARLYQEARARAGPGPAWGGRVG
jgi:GAF domain-containing protein